MSQPRPSSTAYGAEPRISAPGLLAVAALHVAATALLLSMEVIKLPPQIATLMVHIIPPGPPRPPEVTPAMPKPVARRPAPQPRPEPPPQRQQPQMLAVETATPTAAIEVPAAKAAPPPAPAPAAPAVTEPRFDADYLDNPAPLYPAMSRRMEESGKTLLRVFVEPSGKPSHVHVKTSSGSHRLDQAALDAVSRWKFIPARRGDEAVAAWVLVPIVFNLTGG